MSKKIIFFTLIFLISISNFSLANQIEVNLGTKIEKVYLFPDTAILERHQKTNLEKGSYQIIFNDIIEKFNEKSIQVKLKESNYIARINGIAIKKILLEDQPNENLKTLQIEITQLENEIRIINSKKNALKDKKDFLNSMKNIFFTQDSKGNVSSTGDIKIIDQIENMYLFLEKEINENYSQSLDYDFQIEKRQERIDFLQRKIQQITNEKIDEKKDIILDLEVYENSDLNFIISYQLNGEAGWKPHYDVRADIKGNKVELVTYALVKQSTGIDWNNVFASLSTAKPAISGQIPEIVPWFLTPYQLYQKSDKSVDAAFLQMERESFAPQSSTINEDFLIPFEHKGTIVNFNIPYQISVLSGSTQEKILISKTELDCHYDYKAYPRENPFVFFNASISNKLNVPLLPGEVNIFIEEAFVGNSFFNYTPSGENIDISLGIAENVQVKRELLKKYRDETLIANIPSARAVTNYEYKISIDNFQENDVLCQIYENIPVPEDDRIQVKIENINIEPIEKDWNDKKGVWMWEFMLRPGQHEEILIFYSIAHPRDMQIIGLP